MSKPDFDIIALKPFPLPKYIDLLPVGVIQEFSLLYELVKGYIELLLTFTVYKQELAERLQEQTERINKIIDLVGRYDDLSNHIEEQLREVRRLFDEFNSLEVVQYQLLLANFNLNFIKRKYEQMVEESDTQSRECILKYRDHTIGEEQLGYFVKEFRAKRLEYHSRKLKLERWNEDRISGLY
ncbi:uncharacterized protein KQ657_003826 [Scheffersomyces spartinae]|uniref:VPS37 C-terminal domain-containing protein n=1 Tax=Scheffersomyces spartinae TaxID=45513 RepID=A0A9P8AJX8_9ASCO|nr:uncharacterized protein KQ657_003826 [Scheffersomyces spartinae]KAG7195300.1 hypothetical protein KQ657_003826 [Scheffersomyces spartinae]